MKLKFFWAIEILYINNKDESIIQNDTPPYEDMDSSIMPLREKKKRKRLTCTPFSLQTRNPSSIKIANALKFSWKLSEIVI